MAALQGAFRKPGYIAQRPDLAAEPLQNRFSQLGVQHSGAPVQDHPADTAVRMQVPKPLDHRQHRVGRPSGIHRQDHRTACHLRHLVRAGLCGKADSVVKAHDPLRYRQREAFTTGSHPKSEHIRV